MKRPLFYSWWLFWFSVTLGGSFISSLAFLILTFDGWCHMLICQCNFWFPLEDLQSWILVYEDKSLLKLVGFVFLNSSVTSIIYWCVIYKATCGTYTHQNHGRHERLCILLSFKHKFLMCQDTLRRYWTVLPTEHIEKKLLLVSGECLR